MSQDPCTPRNALHSLRFAPVLTAPLVWFRKLKLLLRNTWSVSRGNYPSWRHAYETELVYCALLTTQQGSRCFGLLGIENKSWWNRFGLLANCCNCKISFYDSDIAYNPPTNFSVIWP
jgi:hypothetical protein